MSPCVDHTTGRSGSICDQQGVAKYPQQADQGMGSAVSYAGTRVHTRAAPCWVSLVRTGFGTKSTFRCSLYNAVPH